MNPSPTWRCPLKAMRHHSSIRVWDPLVRLFHWGLAAAFTAGWLTRTGHYDWHLAAGYTVLGLVLVRLGWGFVGPRHARFADFVRGPRAVLGYLFDAVRGRARRHVGHNPAGGAMILAMLVTLLVIGLSGVALDAAENRAGPLAQTRLFLYTDLISRLHTAATDLCLVLIGLHLLGVLHASLAHGENLPWAMVTGRKRGPDAPSTR